MNLSFITSKYQQQGKLNMAEIFTKDFANMETPRADLFWMKQATELRGTLAGQDTTFIASATLEQIEAVAGDNFSKQGENTKKAIIEVMRRTN